MRKSMKAALLSALVFPGLGHFYFKKPLQGSILSGIAVLCLYFLLTAVVDIAQELSVKIQSGEIPVDVIRISELVSQSLAGSEGQIVNNSSLVLVILWVVAVIDSFRIGWSQEKTGDSSSKKHSK